MIETCPKCGMPYAQGLWVVPDPWTYCDDPVVCDAVAAAYQRGRRDGIEEMRIAAHRSARALNDAKDSRMYGANVVANALDAEAAKAKERTP